MCARGRKNFGPEVIFFVAKDENIHPKYLEAKLIDIAIVAGRYEVDNDMTQREPMLARADRNLMEQMLRDINLILGVLGHRILEPLPKATISTADEATSTIDGPLLDREFSFSGRNFAAQGRLTDEGFLIFNGSTASVEETASRNPGLHLLREKLLNDGTLLKINEKQFKFTRDYLANSSSQAASILAGQNRSGPASWISDSKTLRELEAAAIDGKSNATSKSSVVTLDAP